MSVKLFQQPILNCDACGRTELGSKEMVGDQRPQAILINPFMAGQMSMAPEANWVRHHAASVSPVSRIRPRTRDLCPECHRRVEAAIERAMKEGAPLQ